MAKDPEQRFRSARSFARELRQWLDANPVGPEGDALGATVPAAAIPTPRRRIRWIAIGATLAVMATAAAAIWWQGSAVPTTATGAATTATKPTADARPPVAATPGIVAATRSSTPPLPSSTAAAPPATGSDPAAPLAGNAADTPPPIPTGANNPAAQEALLLASIVPMPILGATRPADPAKANPPAGEPAAPTTPTAAKETAKDRKAREAKERETRDARERELRLAATKPAAVPTGTVRIAISPWGNVEVDGAASGVAPPLTELTLAEGRHQIVVRNGDFAPFVATINVVAGQTASIRHKFGGGS
jgi:serine/threonine-protein kinase